MDAAHGHPSGAGAPPDTADEPAPLAGATGDAPATLFVAAARLTAERDPLPLSELVSVRVRDGRGTGTGPIAREPYGRPYIELEVVWRVAPARRFGFTVPDGRAAPSPWTVTPR